MQIKKNNDILRNWDWNLSFRALHEKKKNKDLGKKWKWSHHLKKESVLKKQSKTNLT